MTGFCRAPGCRAGDPVGGGLPALTNNPWLCTECDGLARSTVTRAAVLYLAVREQVPPGSHQGERRRTAAGPASAAPLRVDMADLAVETVGLFVQWAAIWSGRNVAPYPSVREFAHALAELETNHDAIMRSDLAPAYAGDLRHWDRKARQLTGLSARPQRIPIPCPECDLRGIRWYPDDRELHCHGCGAHGPRLATRELWDLVSRAGSIDPERKAHG